MLSLAVLSVLYGSYAATRDWFPTPLVRKAVGDWNELRANWRNDLKLEPTRHLVTAPSASREPFVAHVPDALGDGPVLVAGLTPGRETLQGATLYAPDGHELHRWNVDYEALVPNGVGEYNVLLHGLAAFEDGSIVVAFDAGRALARVDACGATRWVAEGGYHHVVSRTADGSLWTWREEVLVRLDGESGEVLEEVDLRKDIIERHDLYGAFAIRSSENEEGFRWFGDAFHANDVEALDPAMAEAFPMFAAGDLLISLRELNLVAVVDPADGRVKWHRHGPWFKQHDPDFTPDGRIVVYDNRMGIDGRSRLVAIDPATDEREVILADSPETPFYSWRRGKQQVLANGHLLVTESERGRVFEVDADGRLLWERQSVHDAAHNAILTSAERFPADFFEPGAFDCSPVAAAIEPVTALDPS